ncbi:MAG: DUF1643 domain-containing protein [Lachnospiraceae bacterium]|nr:DUF1643 domain-containing protein [Lachnospiraceae bacterium]
MAGKKGKEKPRVVDIELSCLKEMLRKAEGDEDGIIYQVGDTEKQYRYVLWEKGNNPLICIGANPSEAGRDENHPTDPTITRIRNLVKRINETEGDEFDGWIMLNLYPQRTPKPKALHKEETYDKEVMKKNHEIIQIMFDEFKKAKTLLAWGNIIDLEEREYLKESFKKIVSIGGQRKWCIRGEMTLKNNPRHQLYVKGGTKMEPVRIDEGGKICKIGMQEMSEILGK